jgi:hypothetical protein
MKKRDFYLLRFGEWGFGNSADLEYRVELYWGTFFEAARELIRRDQSSVEEKKHYRSIEVFRLPDVSNKRKPFYIF